MSKIDRTLLVEDEDGAPYPQELQHDLQALAYVRETLKALRLQKDDANLGAADRAVIMFAVDLLDEMGE